MFSVLAASWALALVIWDLRYQRLPNVLTVLGGLIAVVLALSYDPGWLLGGVAWAGCYGLLAVVGAGVGGGDVKLAWPLGIAAATAGVKGVWLAVVLAAILTVLAGLITRRREVPHGPGMILGTCGGLLLG